MGDMNDKRAVWAQEAMEAVPAFAQMLEPEEGGPYTAVKDLLCDLMHFCGREKIDFEDALEGARDLYDGEVEDDE